MFSHNKKSVSPIFLQNLTLPAVAIKLYCFKLLFEHYFCLNNRPFVFPIIYNNFDSGCHSNKIWNEAKFLCQVLTACKVSKKSNRRLLRYCTFIFSFSCSIASVMSYLIENEAENLQNGDVHLAQFPDFEMEYLENHLSLTFFRPEVPFKDVRSRKLFLSSDMKLFTRNPLPMQNSNLD